ncbi:MAG: hypothetical protein AUF79_08850 [Crenarchaeota archaeon 13_1_20CM_2_51_8]|nr:MAG: hypothetical protein AUF79_08850 [Crenarchaeota archaeon 13_1_20CM_2_51_8]
MPELDDVDARILGILVEDGRRSFREIARRAGITTPTVQTRIKRMMDEGLILGVSPIFNPSKFQLGLVFQLYLRLTQSRLRKLRGRSKGVQRSAEYISQQERTISPFESPSTV